MTHTYFLMDKTGTRVSVDWNVFCDISKKYIGWTDTNGKPLLHNRRSALATADYFDLVDRGFLS